MQKIQIICNFLCLEPQFLGFAFQKMLVFNEKWKAQKKAHETKKGKMKSHLKNNKAKY